MGFDNLLIGLEFLWKRKRKQLIYFQNILRKMIVIFCLHKNSFKSMCYKLIYIVILFVSELPNKPLAMFVIEILFCGAGFVRGVFNNFENGIR